MAVWDPIWENDSYSNIELRKIKTVYKVDSFYKYLNLNKEDLCVDLGCGGGYISAEIIKRCNCKVIGFDVSKIAIEFAQKNNSIQGNEFFVESAENLPLSDACADVVLCIGVLEHIRNIDRALSEIHRILKPNGKIIVISSNRYSFMYFDRLFKQLFGKWKYGYQKNWTPKSLKRKLQSKGIKVINTEILQGIGDFNKKNHIDSIFNKVCGHWGRYVQFVGESIK